MACVHSNWTIAQPLVKMNHNPACERRRGMPVGLFPKSVNETRLVVPDETPADNSVDIRNDKAKKQCDKELPPIGCHGIDQIFALRTYAT
jgi:hypothetical protein